jgi:ABC-2 type transport system permease protein
MSKFINKALLIEQIKRFWAVSALALVAYIFIVYIPILNQRDDWWAMRQLVQIITMGNPLMLFIMVATPVIATFFTFGFFFNKRASGMFYSLPLNKNQLFATSALAGIILSIIPLLVFCVILLFPLGFHTNIDDAFHMRTWVSSTFAPFSPQGNLPLSLLPGGAAEGAVLNTFPIIAGLFGRMALATVFYTAVAWLAFSLAGHGFIALCLVAVLPFIPAGIWMTIEGVGFLYVFGYNGMTVAGEQVFNRLFVYHNPAAWGLLFRSNDVFTRFQAVWLPVIIYIVLGSALFAGAWLVSRNRKPERTGNSIIFNPVKNVLIMLVAMIAMVITGAIFYGTSESFVNMHLGFIVGFAIGYVIAQMVAEKTFMIIGKIKYLPAFAGIAAGLYVVMLLVTQFGLGFYVNRVPAENEISAVYVSNWNLFSNLSEEEWSRIKISDPDFIAATRRAHQTILDNRSDLSEIPHLNRGTRYEWQEDINRSVRVRENLHIKYFLQNGRTMVRQYSITRDFIEAAEGFDEFLTRREVVLAPFVAFKMPEYLQSVELSFQFPEFNEEFEHWNWTHHRSLMITNREEISSVMEKIADAAMENAAEIRGHQSSWRQNVHHVWVDETNLVEPDPFLNIWFNLDWNRIDIDGRVHLPMWNTPHVTGEAVQRLYDAVRDYGEWRDERRWR